MRNSSSIVATLSLNVVVIPDDSDEAPLTEKDQHELSRLLLHRLTVLRAALRRVKELKRGAALAQPNQGDEPNNKQP
jgi:hypothetical protein